MTAKKKQQPRVWEPPARDALLHAFEQAYAARPDTVTLTIILKLLTQRDTEALLHTTQMRVTNMLHDVTVRFFPRP